MIGNHDIHLTLHNSYGPPEKMPVSVFFREEGDLTPLEHCALRLCSGSILDIGAGAGAFSMILQERHDVTALEISTDACEIARMLGVKQVVNADVMQYHERRYDTLLMIMNGIGLIGKVGKLTDFFLHLKMLLNRGGQILLDSSDLSYLYENLKSDNTLGEISYQYEYKGIKDPWFNWLYVDQKTLGRHAAEAGFEVQIVHEDDMDQYLAILKEI